MGQKLEGCGQVPRDTWATPELEEAGRTLPSSLQRECSPANTSSRLCISGTRRRNFCVLNTPFVVLWLVWQPEDTDIYKYPCFPGFSGLFTHQTLSSRKARTLFCISFSSRNMPSTWPALRRYLWTKGRGWWGQTEPLPVNASLPRREPPMQDRAAHRSKPEPLRGQTAEPLPCTQARLPEARRGSRLIKFHESSSANGVIRDLQPHTSGRFKCL